MPQTLVLSSEIIRVLSWIKLLGVFAGTLVFDNQVKRLNKLVPSF